MISFNCPFCLKYLEAAPDALNRRIQCGHCEYKFTLEEKHLISSEKPQEKENVSADISATKTLRQRRQTKKKKSNNLVPILFFLILLGAGGIIFTIKKQTPQKQQSANSDVSPNTEESKIARDDKAKDLTDKSDGLQPLTESFPVIQNFERINISEWRKNYPDVHNGWMPNGLAKVEGLNPSENEALRWGHYFGPLGIRVRSHIPQHQNRQAFSAMVPDCLQTKDGELGLSAIEVVSIIPGSPADGHLQIGDLIIAIEDEYIKPGKSYRPEWDFVFKDRRDVQLQAGELIDKAQARGDIRLKVLRWEKESKTLFESSVLNKDNQSLTLGAMAVKAGQKLKLIIDADGKNNYDHACWIKPTLSGSKGTLDLSKTAPESATTGWGQILRGKDFKGNKTPESSITVHGHSELIFTVPEGYDQFTSEVNCLHNNGSFKVKVEVEEKRPALPVGKELLWSGKGGNDKVGIQSFELPVKPGKLILNVDQFNGNIHGDGAVWMDLEITGNFGSKKLIELPWVSANTGYGRVKKYQSGETVKVHGSEKSNAIYVHANANLVYIIPQGTTGLKGKFAALSYGQVQPRIYLQPESLPLTGEHASKVVDLRFPIGKTASFAKGFPLNCRKTDLTIKRQVEWLAAQQLENGSWPRWGGYTHSYWDTAHAGLALMSTGDKKYDEAIKKAAYYCAFKAPSSWTVPRSMILIFLSEYYLRYKDRSVLASIQNNYSQLESCIKTDLISGHKVLGFGYGIAGQYIATGHMMLGMAMAAKVPINIDSEFVDEIITHSARVAVNGTYPYGRGRRMPRSDKRDYTGGNAMLGPALLAAYVYGGHETFLEDCKNRFRASLGDGDNSHATSSLAFIWSTTAMSVLDDELYRDHLEHFKYKLTIDDCWDGGYLKSAFPMDFQGGEGVTGLWIRTAGTIMGLCAYKKNLAITGAQEFKPSKYKKGIPATEWETFIHQYYHRNWLVAQELLGNQCPQPLKEAIAKISAIQADDLMVKNTADLVQSSASAIIRAISRNKNIKDNQLKAYAIELICGLDFQITVSPEGNNQKIELLTLLPFNELNWNSATEDKEKFFNQSSLPFEAEIHISSDKISKPVVFKLNDKKNCNYDRGQIKSTIKVPSSANAGQEFGGKATIAFKVGETSISYEREILFNKPFENSRVGNPVNFRRFKLPLKMAPRAIYQSLPIQIGGINFDAMYPAEQMMYPSFKGQRSSGVPWIFHEGDDVIVDFVSSTPICFLVLDLDFQKKMEYAKAQNIKIIQGEAAGNINAIADGNFTTGINLKPYEETAIIEFDFGKETTLNGMDIVKKGGGLVRIWAEINSKWIPIIWDDYSSYANFHPEFYTLKAKRWRVELQRRGNIELKDILFYHNKNRRKLPRPVQLDDHTTFPGTLLNKGA